MHASSSYDYAIIRVVPSVERGECINVGVLLFCRTQRFLGALIDLDTRRLLSLAPSVDLEAVQHHLDTIALICEGQQEAGYVGQLSQAERFHWLVSPRSTIIQMSPVHSGLCSDPAAALHHLLSTMVHVATSQEMQQSHAK
ncbi:MAG: DUF3037 domain-containing protein [Chloroflexi bacterium]|nr:MAG: DUF3037 domain-containing protein [Chloroflexota bacterium]